MPFGILICLIFSYSSRAEETAPVIVIEKSRGPHLETWYWGIALGAGGATFSESRGESVSALKSNPTFSSFTMGTHLHFYWPIIAPTTLFGVAGGGVVTYIFNALEAKLKTYFGIGLYTASILHTFGEEPGLGPLVRGGIGIGVAYESTLVANSRYGPAFRLGAGYGISIGEDTRLIAEFTYGQMVGTGTDSYWMISVGPLF